MLWLFRVVVDGAYAAKPFLRPLLSEGVTVISRLRRDAKLFDLPPQRTGQRGRPRIYGENRIHLSKRAGQQQVRNVWSNIGCWHLNT